MFAHYPYLVGYLLKALDATPELIANYVDGASETAVDFRFDPERFTPENEKALPRYAYFPFGGGPRICIGNSFAMMEAKLILATIVQHHRLSLVPGHSVAAEPLITLRPKYGMKMVVQGR